MRVTSDVRIGRAEASAAPRSVLVFLCLAVSLLLASGSTAAAPPAPSAPSTQAPHLQLAERAPLLGDVVHYRWNVDFGSGPYDQMQVHRVVREKRPFRPIRTHDGVLLVPGMPESFEIIFMPRSTSAVPGWDRSFAVYLAQHDF